ncbi:TetR/AcrR family transcriptional regulator [Rhodococcus gannanensis]|uniref:TetR/AcrR family transcriptional regulator n=1 Tax=Rhodococcus gannanensis TaxID=1960308 RepID=A0ABW4P9D7_9NOCA
MARKVELDGPREDPRRARSRARLLDAATALLARGGIDAVTIDAVTEAAHVARATLYRHFDSGTELLAAAFARLVPPASSVPEGAPLRDQLIALLEEQDRVIDEAPTQLTALCWLGMGPGIGDPGSGRTAGADRTELHSLRQRIVARYREPFDRVFVSEECRDRLGEFDHDVALAQLIGPLVFARLATLPPLDARARVQIVDDFLSARSRTTPDGTTAAEGEAQPLPR